MTLNPSWRVSKAGFEMAKALFQHSNLLWRKLAFLHRQLVSSYIKADGLWCCGYEITCWSARVTVPCKRMSRAWSTFCTHFTDEILTNADLCNIREMKKTVCKIDRKVIIERCLQRAPAIASMVTQGGSWTILWDQALHLGSKHLHGLQNLFLKWWHIRVRALNHVHSVTTIPHQLLIEHLLTLHHVDIGLRNSTLNRHSTVTTCG